MKLLCWRCWLLTLTKCDFLGVPSRRLPRCYKSAIQHVDDRTIEHLCEDHASSDRYATHTLLGFGRYRVPTKVAWVALLLALKFLILPACGIDVEILPLIKISG